MNAVYKVGWGLLLWVGGALCPLGHAQEPGLDCQSFRELVTGTKPTELVAVLGKDSNLAVADPAACAESLLRRPPEEERLQLALSFLLRLPEREKVALRVLALFGDPQCPPRSLVLALASATDRWERLDYPLSAELLTRLRQAVVASLSDPQVSPDLAVAVLASSVGSDVINEDWTAGRVILTNLLTRQQGAVKAAAAQWTLKRGRVAMAWLREELLRAMVQHTAEAEPAELVPVTHLLLTVLHALDGTALGFAAKEDVLRAVAERGLPAGLVVDRALVALGDRSRTEPERLIALDQLGFEIVVNGPRPPLAWQATRRAAEDAGNPRFLRGRCVNLMSQSGTVTGVAAAQEMREVCVKLLSAPPAAAVDEQDVLRQSVCRVIADSPLLRTDREVVAAAKRLAEPGQLPAARFAAAYAAAALDPAFARGVYRQLAADDGASELVRQRAGEELARLQPPAE